MGESERGSEVAKRREEREEMEDKFTYISPTKT